MDRKGFTLVELISTFALASVIIVLLMNVVILIKDVYNQNNVKTQLMIEQSNLSKIMNEEFNKQLVGYEWCNDSVFCYIFNFSDGSSSKLNIEDNKITFNKYVYKMDKGVEIVDPKISREYVDINDESNTDNFIRIKIPVVSKLYPNKDYGVDIVLDGPESMVDSGGDTGDSGETEETSICTLVSDSEYIEGQIGAKYNCKVDPNKEPYTFHILSHNGDGTSNLILDRNVYYNSVTGESGLTDEDHLGAVVWVNKTDYENAGYKNWDEKYSNNSSGPITALNYLANATSTWTNLTKKLIGPFSDENGKTHAMYARYLYARLPHYSELRERGCLGNADLGLCPVWLVNNLASSTYYVNKKTNIEGIYGYWTLSAVSVEFCQERSIPIGCCAWIVEYSGNVHYRNVANKNGIGVRPVITVDLNPQ